MQMNTRSRSETPNWALIWPSDSRYSCNERGQVQKPRRPNQVRLSSAPASLVLLLGVPGIQLGTEGGDGVTARRLVGDVARLQGIGGQIVKFVDGAASHLTAHQLGVVANQEGLVTLLPE